MNLIYILYYFEGLFLYWRHSSEVNVYNIVDTINPLVLPDYTVFGVANRTTKLFATLFILRPSELLVFTQSLVAITIFKRCINPLRMEQINTRYTLTIQCSKNTYFFFTDLCISLLADPNSLQCITWAIYVIASVKLRSMGRIAQQ